MKVTYRWQEGGQAREDVHVAVTANETYSIDCAKRPVAEVKPAHRIDPVLQPGDEATFDVAPARLVHNVYAPDEPLPPRAANGTLTRTLKAPSGGAEWVIPITWPYVILGGELTLTGGAAAEVHISADGELWAPLTTRADGDTHKADFIPWFVARKDARCNVSLRVGGAPKEATLTVLFQFAPRALPAVRPGTTIVDVAISPVAAQFPSDWKGLEITHEWEVPDQVAK